MDDKYQAKLRFSIGKTIQKAVFAHFQSVTAHEI